MYTSSGNRFRPVTSGVLRVTSVTSAGVKNSTWNASPYLLPYTSGLFVTVVAKPASSSALRSSSAVSFTVYGPSVAWFTSSLNWPFSSWRRVFAPDAKPKSSVVVDSGAVSQLLSSFTHLADTGFFRIAPKNLNSSSSTWSGSPQLEVTSIFQ